MELINRIKAHAASSYSSSPITYTDEEIEVIIENECKCNQCGESIFSLHDFPNIIDGNVYCEYCQEEMEKERCVLCKKYFEGGKTPQDTLLYISSELAEISEIPQRHFWTFLKRGRKLNAISI